MSEDQKTEQRPKDGKIEDQEEVHSNISPEQVIVSPALLDQTSEIPKSEIENMEVHHHPVPHKAGEKKNFKEYLLEGLMIFIAVTMGFFAETIRESLVEKNQARSYIGSLDKDISNDVQVLPKLIQYQTLQIKLADSLVSRACERRQATRGVPRRRSKSRGCRESRRLPENGRTRHQSVSPAT